MKKQDVCPNEVLHAINSVVPAGPEFNAGAPGGPTTFCVLIMRRVQDDGDDFGSYWYGGLCRWEDPNTDYENADSLAIETSDATSEGMTAVRNRLQDKAEQLGFEHLQVRNYSFPPGEITVLNMSQVGPTVH